MCRRLFLCTKMDGVGGGGAFYILQNCTILHYLTSGQRVQWPLPKMPPEVVTASAHDLPVIRHIARSTRVRNILRFNRLHASVKVAIMCIISVWYNWN